MATSPPAAVCPARRVVHRGHAEPAVKQRLGRVVARLDGFQQRHRIFGLVRRVKRFGEHGGGGSPRPSRTTRSSACSPCSWNRYDWAWCCRRTGPPRRPRRGGPRADPGDRPPARRRRPLPGMASSWPSASPPPCGPASRGRRAAARPRRRRRRPRRTIGARLVRQGLQDLGLTSSCWPSASPLHLAGNLATLFDLGAATGSPACVATLSSTCCARDVDRAPRPPACRYARLLPGIAVGAVRLLSSSSSAASWCATTSPAPATPTARSRSSSPCSAGSSSSPGSCCSPLS